MEEEILQVVDNTGKQISRALRVDCHSNPNLIHPVVHLHVFNPDHRLYLQQRALTKDLYPGYWDTSVGGHISDGESVIDALRREAEEELGIKVKNASFLFNYIWKNKNETEYVHTYKLMYSGPIILNSNEIKDGNFFSFMEIEEMIRNDKITPNFIYEFRHLNKDKNQEPELNKGGIK